MEKARVVLTGATGLIGRQVVERLSGTHEQIALGRSAPSGGATWIRSDLSEPLDASVLPESAESVIYLAQSDYFRDFPQRAGDIFEVNVANLQRMLEWARRAGVRRFILASSGGVYGHGDSAFREDDSIGPRGPLGYYLASKQCSELLAGSYADCFTVVILRFFFVYGPGQKKSMLLPRLIDSVKSGRAITLQSENGIRINPICVTDAAAAVARALALGNSQIINVAGGEVFSLRQLGSAIGRAVDRLPLFDVRRSDEPRHLVADIEKMRQLLGPPTVSFEQGLKLTLEGGKI